MKRGEALEHLVSRELQRLNVPHELTGRWSHDDTVEKVDLRVGSRWFDPAVEIQLTFKRYCLRKARDFVAAALRNFTERGPRLYLEVHAPHRGNLEQIARRVAWAIKSLVTNLKDFGPLRILAYRLYESRCTRDPRHEAFDLVEFVKPSWLSRLVDRIFQERKANRPPPSVPFWRPLAPMRPRHVTAYLRGPQLISTEPGRSIGLPRFPSRRAA